MAQQVPVGSQAQVEHANDGPLNEVTHDVAYQRLGIVNVVYFGAAGATAGQWVLIDAGLMGTAGFIRRAVEQRFGPASPPAAIVMTHGHFDHVGALEELAQAWQVPVFAHQLELPYLDGSQSYPPPDPTVGGGLMAAAAGLYPRGPVDVSGHLQTLPQDGSVPGMPGWQWLATPGHTPGHISLWRETDRTLIAGDAFITTAQESAYAVLTQKPELHGPPMYFTPDWRQAKQSVELLAELEPQRVITGHGPPLEGPELRIALHTLARDFDEVAVPKV